MINVCFVQEFRCIPFSTLPVNSLTVLSLVSPQHVKVKSSTSYRSTSATYRQLIVNLSATYQGDPSAITRELIGKPEVLSRSPECRERSPASFYPEFKHENDESFIF